MALFADCKTLYSLNLRYTVIADDGLANFKSTLTTLTWLNLDGSSKVTDAGLDHFSGCKNLTRLHLLKTIISAAKFEELKKTHPKCRIESDHGIYEPK